jgi:hypothetical protein
MIFAMSPASAQRYDPKYPVCMEVYGSDGSRIECFYTSMEQCRAAAQGMAGLCSENAYYVPPPPEPEPAAETAPAPSAKPAKPRRSKAVHHDAPSTAAPSTAAKDH